MVLFDLASSLGGVLNLRDVIGPFIGIAGGYLVARMSARENARVTWEKMDAEKEAKQDEVREARRVAVADDLSRRFAILMDGYEVRIKDLVDEVQMLRHRVEVLTEQLNAAPRALCETCKFRAEGQHATA